MFMRLVTSLALTSLACSIAVAAPSASRKSLEKLEPGTRMTEVCDMQAAADIGRSSAYKTIDRVVADARQDVHRSGNSVTAPGAAFRNKGKWYALRYSCTVTADGLSAKIAKFTIGSEIPKSRWEEYGLWQ